MKKILLYIDGMNSGGAQRQMIGLARYLKTVPSYEVRLLFYKKNADFYRAQLDEYGIDYFYDRSSDSKMHGLLALRKQVKEYKPDIIISFLGENNLFACLNRLVCRIPLIVSERNTTIQATGFDHIRFFLYRWADRIVPNSYSQGKYLCSNFGGLSKKVVPIINFVDTDAYKPSEEKKYWKERRIIIAARVVPQKNVISIIKSVKRVVNMGCNNFHITWIGNLGVEQYVDKCKKMIKEKALEDYFSFAGECKNMTHAYHKADAFCLPSFYEGTPNVVCEAMASGLPILCSDVCDNGRYIENGINGLLFNPHDEESMANVVREFLQESDDAIAEMGRNSRIKALNSFSLDKFQAQWHEQIKQLTN